MAVHFSSQWDVREGARDRGRRRLHERPAGGAAARRAGWDVDVFERVESELAGRGAGIVAQPDLIATLRRLGIDPTDLGVEITTRKILDAIRRLTGEFACPQVLTAWERVYRALRDAFPGAALSPRPRASRSFAQTERR